MTIRKCDPFSWNVNNRKNVSMCFGIHTGYIVSFMCLQLVLVYSPHIFTGRPHEFHILYTRKLYHLLSFGARGVYSGNVLNMVACLTVFISLCVFAVFSSLSKFLRFDFGFLYIWIEIHYCFRKIISISSIYREISSCVLKIVDPKEWNIFGTKGIECHSFNT